jgi:multidrug efflux pump subunit AcrB
MVKSDTQYDALNIDKIIGQKIMTKSGPLTLGSLITYKFSNALIDVRRVDGDLTISVESDVRDGFKAGDLLIELNKYAQDYAYPEGVSFKK